MTSKYSNERLERWRLLLGGHEADGIGYALTGRALAMDKAMAALYDGPGERRAGLGASAPNAARWLGDIREYFPSSVVRVMQKDAIERLGLQRLLLEPEMLSAVEPDLDLLTTLMALSGVIPQRAKATARLVVQRVVQDLLKRLAAPMRQAVTGALKRSARNMRPRHNEIDRFRCSLRHAARARRRRRSVIRHKERGGAGGHGHSQLRLHAGSLPRADGGGDSGPRSRPMGIRARPDHQPRRRRVATPSTGVTTAGFGIVKRRAFRWTSAPPRRLICAP